MKILNTIYSSNRKEKLYKVTLNLKEIEILKSFNNKYDVLIDYLKDPNEPLNLFDYEYNKILIILRKEKLKKI